jgi:hypothetical protein
MQAARSQAIIDVREVGIKQRLPLGFMNNVQQYLRLILNDSEEDLDADLRDAVASQQKIGPLMFIRGYLSSDWLRLLRSYDNVNPEQKLAWLVRIIWDQLVETLWKTRNDILHRNANYVSENTHAQLGDRLIWYTEHKDELSRRDQFLARHTLSQIEAMTTSQRREWVRHLDVARAAWAKEKAILLKGQTLITQYFAIRDNNG